MQSSTITAKYQTTVPKDIRERLGLAVGGTLHWQVAGQEARLTAATPEWRDLQGVFRVPGGDPVADVKKARKKMGTGHR